MISHPTCQPITELLRAMPSSLNDACRTMEEAADRIEFLEGQVDGLRESFSDLAEIANPLKARIQELEGALREAMGYIADFGDDYHSASTIRRLRAALEAKS